MAVVNHSIDLDGYRIPLVGTTGRSFDWLVNPSNEALQSQNSLDTREIESNRMWSQRTKMGQKSEKRIGGLTRRNALKTGLALTSGSVLGSAAIGTVGANDQIVADVVGEHHFVRAADDSDAGSPIPDPQDRLVERRLGNPVDDGTDESELDGTHQLRWGEFSAVNGEVSMEGSKDGTDVNLWTTGLVPNKKYTAWVVIFHDPGFDFSSREIFPFAAPGTAAEHLLGAGPLGRPTGSENNFQARGSRGVLSAHHPPGELPIPGPEGPYTVEGSLLDEFEVHIVGDMHLDGTFGPGPFPAFPGEHVEHFGAAFKEGSPI